MIWLTSIVKIRVLEAVLVNQTTLKRYRGIRYIEVEVTIVQI